MPTVVPTPPQRCEPGTKGLTESERTAHVNVTMAEGAAQTSALLAWASLEMVYLSIPDISECPPCFFCRPSLDTVPHLRRRPIAEPGDPRRFRILPEPHA